MDGIYRNRTYDHLYVKQVYYHWTNIPKADDGIRTHYLRFTKPPQVLTCYTSNTVSTGFEPVNLSAIDLASQPLTIRILTNMDWMGFEPITFRMQTECTTKLYCAAQRAPCRNRTCSERSTTSYATTTPTKP